ncbi:MAG: SDR family NAD(P)-dependent oxidoreductase [Bryobacteraceae bacterium]
MTESRVVLVTGGAYGIGRGIVQEFASKGETVVIADCNTDRGKTLESSLRDSGREVLFVNADVRIESQVHALVERVSEVFGRIDVLCNNAGIERYRRARSLSRV